MRTKRRRRRQISQARLTLLSPVVRYCYQRDAYILRGVGEQIGPVFTVTPAPATVANKSSASEREGGGLS